MTNCPICNRQKEDENVWCEDCVDECMKIFSDSDLPLVDWAANRAREFERDRAKVLVEALELELSELQIKWIQDVSELADRLKLAESEIERLKAQNRELEEVNKSVNNVVIKLSNQFLESQERLRRTAQILIEEVGADGPMNAEDAAEKAVKRLRSKPTAKQEREAILEYIRLCKIVVGGKTAERLEILAKDIEYGLPGK